MTSTTVSEQKPSRKHACGVLPRDERTLEFIHQRRLGRLQKRKPIRRMNPPDGSLECQPGRLALEQTQRAVPSVTEHASAAVISLWRRGRFFSRTRGRSRSTSRTSVTARRRGTAGRRRGAAGRCRSTGWCRSTASTTDGLAACHARKARTAREASAAAGVSAAPNTSQGGESAQCSKRFRHETATSNQTEVHIILSFVCSRDIKDTRDIHHNR